MGEGGRDPGSSHIDKAHVFPPGLKNWLPDSSPSRATVLWEMGETLWGSSLPI